MARVTVEDCIDKIDNRFDMVLLSAHRARQLAAGAQATVEIENDKPTVLSLREIAEEKISADELNASIIQTYRKVADKKDEDEEEE